MNTKAKFVLLLLKWNEEKNTRSMPWKAEKNPYLIWLSEIILQQTRVEQGLPYFLKFKKKYPTVKKLAHAHEDEVMKLWQGLGYYSRARYLHETAKNIYLNRNGKFPNTYNDLIKLKGVGTYTAAAIASFAFGEKRAVVDGNVIRVLSRVFGISTPFDTTTGKKEFEKLAQELISEKNPAAYNQAIMDFGGTVCMPQKPLCNSCPLSKICVAKKQELIEVLPYREKKTKVSVRHFNYLIIKSKREIFIRKRTGNDIWKNLYELPLIETAKPLNQNIKVAIEKFLGTEKFSIYKATYKRTQLLSHQKIHFCFYKIELKNFQALSTNTLLKVKLKALHNFAFPRTIHLVLEQNSLL
jgi:A/G-specific adenine glycosylase